MFSDEKKLADFIIKNPWIIKEDLIFLGNEVSTHYDEDGRIDLLFKDGVGHFWVIELKRGVVTSSAVAQLVKYVGALANKHQMGKNDFNLVLIGETITSEVKSFCALFGIRAIEFGLVDELKLKIEGYVKNLEKQFQETPKKQENLEGRVPKITKKVQIRYKIVKLKDIQTAASDNLIEICDSGLLSSVFTEKRMELITELLKSKPSSIRELATILDRDVKNVFDDLMKLHKAQIVDFIENGKRRIPTVRKKTIIVKLGE